MCTQTDQRLAIKKKSLFENLDIAKKKKTKNNYKTYLIFVVEIQFHPQSTASRKVEPVC